jgi:hypothetical protein
VPPYSSTRTLGPELTLSTFGPLLKSKSLNPKATLLALSLNAIHEEESYGGNVIASLQSNKERMRKYLAKLARVRSLRRLAKALLKVMSHCVFTITQGGYLCRSAKEDMTWMCRQVEDHEHHSLVPKFSEWSVTQRSQIRLEQRERKSTSGPSY